MSDEEKIQIAALGLLGLFGRRPKSRGRSQSPRPQGRSRSRRPRRSQLQKRVEKRRTKILEFEDSLVREFNEEEQEILNDDPKIYSALQPQRDAVYASIRAGWDIWMKLGPIERDLFSTQKTPTAKELSEYNDKLDELDDNNNELVKRLVEYSDRKETERQQKAERQEDEWVKQLGRNETMRQEAEIEEAERQRQEKAKRLEIQRQERKMLEKKKQDAADYVAGIIQKEKEKEAERQRQEAERQRQEDERQRLEAAKKAEREQDAERQKETFTDYLVKFWNMFDKVDNDDDGKLSKNELWTYLRANEDLKADLDANVEGGRQRLLKAMDENKDGFLSRMEFAVYCAHKLLGTEPIPQEVAIRQYYYNQNFTGGWDTISDDLIERYNKVGERDKTLLILEGNGLMERTEDGKLNFIVNKDNEPKWRAVYEITKNGNKRGHSAFIQGLMKGLLNRVTKSNRNNVNLKDMKNGKIFEKPIDDEEGGYKKYNIDDMVKKTSRGEQLDPSKAMDLAELILDDVKNGINRFKSTRDETTTETELPKGDEDDDDDGFLEDIKDIVADDDDGFVDNVQDIPLLPLPPKVVNPAESKPIDVVDVQEPLLDNGKPFRRIKDGFKMVKKLYPKSMIGRRFRTVRGIYEVTSQRKEGNNRDPTPNEYKKLPGLVQSPRMNTFKPLQLNLRF